MSCETARNDKYVTMCDEYIVFHSCYNMINLHYSSYNVTSICDYVTKHDGA
jgi:hypothetical protein